MTIKGAAFAYGGMAAFCAFSGMAILAAISGVTAGYLLGRIGVDHE